MKKLFGILCDILPHINLSLAVVLFTFFVIDRFNRAMAFINNDITKWMLAVFCILVLIQSVLYIIFRRREK